MSDVPTATSGRQAVGADLSSRVARWYARAEALRLVRRREGRSWFRRHPEGNRWLDRGWPDALASLVHAEVAAGLDEGLSLQALRTLSQALHEAWDGERRALAAAEARWVSVAPRRTTRLLAPGPDGQLIDTDALPADEARRLLDHLPAAPRIRLIVGDNAATLRSLHAEGVRFDAVLEDPPYATASADLAYDDRWEPGAWEGMIDEHLGLVHALLLSHGQTLLHIDEHRAAALQIAMQRHFGDGWLGSVVWDKRNPKGDARFLASRHERIEWAVRDRAVIAARGGLRRPKPSALRMLAAAASCVDAHGAGTPACQQAWRAWLRAQTDLTAGARAYRELDASGRVYRTVSMAWPNKRTPPPPYFVPLRHPVSGEQCPVPRRGWRHPPDTMTRLLAEGRIRFGADHRTQPTRITYLDEVMSERVPSVWSHAGSDDLDHHERGIDFPYAKPVALLQTLLESCAPAHDALVLDAFAGSGSTAEAAWRAPGRRRIVLCEASESVLHRALLPRISTLLSGLGRGSPDDLVVIERFVSGHT